MPKDRRSSSCRCRASPYSNCYKNADKREPRCHSKPTKNENEDEFEEARCPICMEHPHNAVLLLCSSHEKGCHPYMCNTSSRHSNCLDQFRKSTMNAARGQTKLVCPLCRGQINGWTVVNPARQYMNSKTRNCSLGTCDYAGNYSQLRNHARQAHPCVRPTDVDPERELNWRTLEEDMNHQDMLNMQFEFDDDDDATEFMTGMSDLASPIWDVDFDFVNSFSTLESDFENLFHGLDSASDDTSLLFDDWDDMLAFSSSHEPALRASSRSRNSHTTLFGSEIARRRPNSQLSSRVRGASSQLSSSIQLNSRVRRRSNSQLSSRNRQQQVTTLVDFHELRSNMP